MSPSYEQIAQNFSLWEEYIDPQGYMSEEEFRKLSVNKKVKIIHSIFGEETQKEE